MNIRPNLNRVALEETATKTAGPAGARPLRLWTSLPVETQRQLAQSVARLLLAMRSARRLVGADRHADRGQ